jgi:hypothetical protein
MSGDNSRKDWKERAQKLNTRQQSNAILDMLSDIARNVGNFVSDLGNRFMKGLEYQRQSWQDIYDVYGEEGIRRLHDPWRPLKWAWDKMRYNSGRKYLDEYISALEYEKKYGYPTRDFNQLEKIIMAHGIPASDGWPNADWLARGYQIADSLRNVAPGIENFMYSPMEHLYNVAQPMVWDEYVNRYPGISPSMWRFEAQRRAHREALQRKAQREGSKSKR